MKSFITLLSIGCFMAAGFTNLVKTQETNLTVEPNGEINYKLPKKVKAIVDEKCFGCHSVDGRSDKAKDKLRWDLMHEYDKTKLVSVMDDIIEVSDEKKMPPKKFLEHKPEFTPSQKEYDILKKWAEKEADKIMK